MSLAPKCGFGAAGTEREQKEERRRRERPPDSMCDQARLDVPALVQDTYNIQHLAACAIRREVSLSDISAY